MAYSVYYPGCAEGQPDHVANACADGKEHGRVRSFGYIHKAYLATLLVDPTDSAVWKTGILDKKIIIIPEVSGTYDGGTPVDGPGYGDQESSTAGYNHVVTYKDPNYKGNAPFYNALKFSRNWVPAWRTETQTQIADVPARIIPKAPVTDDMNSEVVWDVEVRFSQPDIPAPFDTPDDTFIQFAYL